MFVHHTFTAFKSQFQHHSKSVKKLVFFFSFSVISTICPAQTDSIGRLIQQITSEKNADRRIDLINTLFMTADVDPVIDLKTAQLLLIESQKTNDKFGIALAYSQIGYDFRAFGNTAKSLEFFLKSDSVAGETGNKRLIAYVRLSLAHHYKDRADFPQALSYYNFAAKTATDLNDHLLQLWSFSSLSQVYLALNNFDSALTFAQRGYELRSFDASFLPVLLQQLGIVHAKLKNHELALSYFSLALKEATRLKSPRWLNETHIAVAEYYHKLGLDDSSVVYARKAISDVENTAFSTKLIKPAKFLLEIYENTNSDSAIKYFKMYRAANDSLFSIRSIQQIQSMRVEDELRQKELAAEKKKKDNERVINIQYAAIGAALILFILLFLLASRSIIVNEKWISFLGILGLLIIFEFINLLFHPFIAGITNHSPVLMLLILVGIAALLIPAHHRLEHWIKHKMVEKNKRIRLAAAKRTIEKLEK
jgi:tetratricopeptide (TPR) repeat protein